LARYRYRARSAAQFLDGFDAGRRYGLVPQRAFGGDQDQRRDRHARTIRESDATTDSEVNIDGRSRDATVDLRDMDDAWMMFSRTLRARIG
jgi:hypothetical protein